ncbi:hypothetical protein ACTHAM_001042 [Cellulomonas soli]|uniref:hypothetical protein n=1 Tax=Cellulomonas soli TaxID=931535 RepID=UPI003F84FF9F
MGPRPRAATPAALLAGVAVLMTVGACSSEESRGPQPITGWRAVGSGVELTVATCHGRPEVTALEETSTAVTVGVTSTWRSVGDSCLDVISVELRDPLGDREVIDALSGAEVPGTRP